MKFSKLSVLLTVCGLAAQITLAGNAIPFQYAFNVANPAKITLQPITREGVYREADTISISTSDGGPIRVYNLNGALVYAGAPLAQHYTRGHYFIETNGDRLEFAVMPDDYSGATFFGLEADTGNSAPSTDRIRNIAPAWVRAHGGGAGIFWNEVEPQRGVWNWTLADQTMAANAGRKIVWSAFIRPAWQTDDSQFITDFTDYVRQVAQRYGSQLYAIEIWNEIAWGTGGNISRLPGTSNDEFAQFYVNLLASARAAIKAVNPNIKIFGPAFCAPDNVGMAQLLADKGAGAYLEGFTWHDYGISNGWPVDSATSFVNDPKWGTTTIPDVAARVANYHAVFPTQELQVNEIGLSGASPLGIATDTTDFYSAVDWYRGMNRAAKFAIMGRAAGLTSMIPHIMAGETWAPPNYEGYGWEYRGRGPHPKTSAFMMACYWMNNATFITRRTPGQRVFLYAWRRPDNTSLVFGWTLEGQPVAVSPGSWTTTDVFGRSNMVTQLSEEPVVFTSSSSDPTVLLNAVLNSLTPNLNLPPVLNPPTSQTVLKGQSLQFTASATDPDNDPVTFTASGLPVGATFNTATGQFSWTPGATQSGTYAVTVGATDARGLTATPVTINLTVLNSSLDGLVGYWKLDDSGTVATDSYGNNPGALRNFNFTAASGWTTGQHDGALRFDGVDDYVSLDSTKPNLALTNNFTVCAWINPHDLSRNGTVFSARSRYGVSGFRFWVAQNGLNLEGQTGSGWKSISFPSSFIAQDTWCQLSIVYDKSTITAYVNGTAKGTANWGSNLVMSPTETSRLGTEFGDYFVGIIDDVRVYNRTLSGAEVLALYQGGNQPPVLNPIGNKSVQAGQTLTFITTGSDPQGAGLSYSATGLPAGATYGSATGLFTWIPTAAQTGTYNLTITVSDGTLSASETITISVATVNQAPVLTSIGNQSVNEGQSLRFTVSGADPNGDALTYSASPLPSGATFNASTQTFSWSPGSTQAGSYNVTFTVSDGSLTASETVTITVGNVNRAPSLNAIGSRSVQAGQTLTFTVAGSDPDGDALVYSAAPLPGGATFNATTHTFAWPPSGSPSNNQAGTYTITFAVSDGALSASESVTITVTAAAVNQPPVLNAIGNKSVNENQALSFTVAGSDPEGSALTFSASNLPAGAAFNTTTQAFNWTPTFTQAGSYAVTFGVSDGSLTTSQTITITVSNVDRAPVLTAIGNKSVNENALLSFTISGSDPDNDPLTYSASGLPSGATFTASTQTFSWTPSYSQAASYSVTFTASDGNLTASQTITITVSNVDRPPVLTAIGNKSTNTGQTLAFTISGSDPDGDTLTYSASGLPSGATFNTSTHAFSWTPASNQTGNYSVTFMVSDGTLTASETITISVGAVNHPPVLAAIGNQSVNENALLSFTISGSDPDNDPLTYSASGLPSGATFTASTQTFSWTPSSSQAGNYAVVFTVSDGQLNESQTITVTATASAIADTAPSLDAVDIPTGVAGSPLSYAFTATDAENDSLTFSAAGLPSGATLAAASGLFTWTPSSAGGYDLTVSVSDGKLSSARVVPLLVVDPRYDWLFGAKLYAPMIINNNIFVFSFRAQGNSSVVFVWTHPGVSATAVAVAGMPRTNLYNQPITSDLLSSSPMVYQAGRRVSPRQALDQVLAAIRY